MKERVIFSIDVEEVEQSDEPFVVAYTITDEDGQIENGYFNSSLENDQVEDISTN